MAHLESICEKWDRDPEGRPPVFFTVGDYAVEVKEFENGGSVCRQFWAWVGLDEGQYDPNQIDIEERDDGLRTSLRVALRDPTTFRIVHTGRGVDGKLTTTISRKGPLVKGAVHMTDQYPPTAFRNAPWPATHKNVPAHTLVFWEGFVEGSVLHVRHFYSKAGDVTTWQLPTKEDDLVRGAGQALFCAVIETLPDVQTFTLEASGAIPHVREQMQRVVASVSDEQITADLRNGNTPKNFRQYMKEWKNPDDRRLAWVQMRSNHALMDYYEKYFGFKAYGDKDSYVTPMTASRSDIVSHCKGERGNWGKRQVKLTRDRPESAPRRSKRQALGQAPTR